MRYRFYRHITKHCLLSILNRPLKTYIQSDVYFAYQNGHRHLIDFFIVHFLNATTDSFWLIFPFTTGRCDISFRMALNLARLSLTFVCTFNPFLMMSISCVKRSIIVSLYMCNLKIG